jgi:hypothetical protein
MCREGQLSKHISITHYFNALFQFKEFENENELLYNKNGMCISSFVKNEFSKANSQDISIQHISTKFFRIFNPVAPLFSGWNWVPITLPCEFTTEAENSSP